MAAAPAQAAKIEQNACLNLDDNPIGTDREQQPYSVTNRDPRQPERLLTVGARARRALDWPGLRTPAVRVGASP